MARISSQLCVLGICATFGALLLPMNGRGADDPQQRKAAASQGQAAARPAPTPAIIGSIDLDRVFKEYEKVKDQSEKFKAEAMKRQGELTRLVESGKNAAQQLEKMPRNSPDYTRLDNEVTKIKAELEAKRGQFEREFAKRESDTLAALYNEVTAMVAATAKQRGMTYVVKITNDPPQGDDAQSVMAVMAKTVVYSDPSMDITGDVVRYLNYNYGKVKAATDAQAQPASATAPAGAGTAAAPKGTTQR